MDISQNIKVTYYFTFYSGTSMKYTLRPTCIYVTTIVTEHHSDNLVNNVNLICDINESTYDITIVMADIKTIEKRFFTGSTGFGRKVFFDVFTIAGPCFVTLAHHLTPVTFYIWWSVHCILVSGTVCCQQGCVTTWNSIHNDDNFFVRGVKVQSL